MRCYEKEGEEGNEIVLLLDCHIIFRENIDN